MSKLLPRQVCAILGICRDTLDRWEEKGLLRPQRIEPLGWRVYDRSEVEELKKRIRPDRQQGQSMLVRV